VEVAAEERHRRAKERHEARVASKEASESAAIAAEPLHRRMLLLKAKPDHRKWWAAPNVTAKAAHLDTSKWTPLEREKAAALAAGLPWPPPDPLEALKVAGATLVGGQWVLNHERTNRLLEGNRPVSRSLLEAAGLDKEGDGALRTMSSDTGEVAQVTFTQVNKTGSRVVSETDVVGLEDDEDAVEKEGAEEKTEQ
jgi:hypothetical protein